MPQTNSTVSLLQLWKLCVNQQSSTQQRGFVDSPLLRLDILRKTLEALNGRAQSLNCSSVEEIMERHFDPGRRHPNHVNFMHYWHGMETILEKCNTYVNSGMDFSTEQQISSIRSFRDRALYRDSTEYSPMDLRNLYEEVRRNHHQSTATYNFWESRLQHLHKLQPDLRVSDDQISSYLLSWLVALLKDHLGYEPPSPEASGSSSKEEDEPDPETARFPVQNIGTCQPRHATEFVQQILGNGESYHPQSRARWDPHERNGAVRQMRSSSSWGPEWLESDEVEPAEVRRFRLQLREQLAAHHDDSNGDFVLALPELFCAVRDSIETGPPDTVVRSGVSILEAVVLRRVRPTFRHWENWMIQGMRKSSQSSCGPWAGPRCRGSDVVVELICSQAKAMEVLEKKVQTVPYLCRVTWIVARARNRCLQSVLAQWRQFEEEPPAHASPPLPVRAASTGNFMVPSPRAVPYTASASGVSPRLTPPRSTPRPQQGTPQSALRM